MQKRDRERVLAEITLSYLMRLAIEQGCPVSREQALEFLNEEGRAYEMWKSHDAGGGGFYRTQLTGAIHCARVQIRSYFDSHTPDLTDRRVGTLFVTMHRSPGT